MAGRIVRQGRLLALLILAAVTFAPGAMHAQEIVLAAAATAAAPVVTTTTSNTKYSQCTADADCVLLDDGCKSATVVNQLYIADANAGMEHDPACRPATPAHRRTRRRRG